MRLGWVRGVRRGFGARVCCVLALCSTRHPFSLSPLLCLRQVVVTLQACRCVPRVGVGYQPGGRAGGQLACMCSAPRARGQLITYGLSGAGRRAARPPGRRHPLRVTGGRRVYMLSSLRFVHCASFMAGLPRVGSWIHAWARGLGIGASVCRAFAFILRAPFTHSLHILVIHHVSRGTHYEACILASPEST